MGLRRYLVGVVAFGLLLWGPINYSWPAWFAIRIAYLIAIPVATWFLLAWVWTTWRPDTTTEDRLARTIAGATAGVLFVGAILAAQTDHHFDCTQAVQTRDGYECVGDYVPAPGPDLGKAFMLVIAAGFAAWFGVRSDI